MKHDERIQEVSREEADRLGGMAEPALSEADAIASINDETDEAEESDAEQAH